MVLYEGILPVNLLSVAGISWLVEKNQEFFATLPTKITAHPKH